MKILILLFSPPTGTWGSLTRVLAIADAAIQKKHRVAFCASGRLADRLKKSEYEVFRMPPSTMFGLPKPISRIIETKSQRITLPIKPGRSFGSIWFVLNLTGMLGYRYLKKLVAAEIKAIKEFMPDLLFTEVDPGAFVTARITGKKLVSTYASVMKVGIGSRAWNKLCRSVNRILKDYQMNDKLTVELFPEQNVLKIIPSIPELEEDIPDTPEYLYTGYLLKSFRTKADEKYDLEEGKRYIFVYVGTGSVSIERLMKVLPEVFPEGSRTICLVGAQSMTKEKRLGNVIFRSFFDAERIIPRCDWVICHGGHNTMIQSLMNGVPLIVFPGPIFERRFNARMVRRAGAGVFAELPNFNPEWLRKTLGNREVCLEKAKILGKKIVSYNGADQAISAMEQIVKGK